MTSDSLEVEKQKRKNNERRTCEIRTRCLKAPGCRKLGVFSPPVRLTLHLECEENEYKNKFRLMLALDGFVETVENQYFMQVQDSTVRSYLSPDKTEPL